MTPHRCGMLAPGDRGQRYEVRFTDTAGKERVFGWTNREDGEPFVGSAILWPAARDPFVVDRSTGEIVREEVTA